MRELERPIMRAWRRMRLQRFFASLVWFLAGGLLASAGVIGAARMDWGIALPPGKEWWPLAIAAGAAVVAAGVLAAFSGPKRFDAAVAVDRAFHLDERLSTALSLPEDLRETPAGRALMADAIKHAKSLDIGSQFGLRVPRRAWVPILPGILAAVAMLVPIEALQAVTQAKDVSTKPADPKEQEAVAKRTEALKKAIAQKREALDPQKFSETAKLLAEVEKATDELSKSSTNKDQALSKLNKISDTLKDRRKELGSADQVTKQLQQLKEMALSGPGDRFAKDLANNNFKDAAKAIKELRDKIASGKMSEQERKQLAEQMQDMKKQLEKLANLDEKRKQLDEARKSGAITQEQHDKEMAKLDQQAQGLEQLNKMAQQLAKASEKMQKGDTKGAAQELGMTEEQLQQMAQNLQELESLDAALADLQDAKNGMANDGLNQLGEGLGSFGGMGDGKSKQAGQGMGRGKGQGDRPIAPDDTAAYTTRVKQQFGKGKGVIEGLGPKGMQTKGESLIEGQATVEAAAGVAAEALTNQKVPSSVKKHIQGYFDQIKGDQ